MRFTMIQLENIVDPFSLFKYLHILCQVLAVAPNELFCEMNFSPLLKLSFLMTQSYKINLYVKFGWCVWWWWCNWEVTLKELQTLICAYDDRYPWSNLYLAHATCTATISKYICIITISAELTSPTQGHVTPNPVPHKKRGLHGRRRHVTLAAHEGRQL